MSAPAPAAAPDVPSVPGRTPLRAGAVSGVWRPRAVAVPVIGLVALVFAAALSVARGQFPLSVGEVLAIFAGAGDRTARLVVLDLRLPRTLTGALVGAALGVAGALTQTAARNPLASPDILGVTAGASAAAVAVVVLAGTTGSVGAGVAAVGLPLAALAGGLLAAALVLGLAGRRGGQRLVLVGIAVQYSALALVSWMLVLAQVAEAARATVWLTGSLNARGWEHVVPVGLALALLLPLALLTAPRLAVLSLGDEPASGLGLPVDRTRTGVVVLAVVLAAVATAGAGPIAFVALVVPQICQRLIGAARPPLIASAVGGALLVVVADLLARTALGTELPVGIVTAVLGAPYLLYLLARHRPGAAS